MTASIRLRGFLGLTVSCARCHDHKFDPIPTRDYYSIAGIYYGTNLTDAPLVSADVLKVFNDAQKLIKDQEEVVNQYLIQTGLLAARSALPDTAKYLMASRKVRDEKLSVDKVAQEAGLNKYFLDRWVKYLDPANAAKVPAEFKEWFTSQARSESLEFIFVAASLAEKIEKIEVPEKGINLPKDRTSRTR